MKTARQRHGDRAENLVAQWLADRRWLVIARNVRLGRDEIDLVAIDPGPPAELVCVEVRSATSANFGAPEERVDSRKVANLYRAAHAFARSGAVRELDVGSLKVRVDLVVVDLRSGRAEIRHLPRLEPA